MDPQDLAPSSFFVDHRGWRQHRFMESSDINVAFREFFRALRSNIRRGMSIGGQVYAIETDAAEPGRLLGASWIPPVSRGIGDSQLLADANRRRALFSRLFAEHHPESLFAYVSECATDTGQALLYAEIVSEDGFHSAQYPIQPGRGWHVRELVEAPHTRADPLALA